MAADGAMVDARVLVNGCAIDLVGSKTDYDYGLMVLSGVVIEWTACWMEIEQAEGRPVVVLHPGLDGPTRIEGVAQRVRLGNDHDRVQFTIARTSVRYPSDCRLVAMYWTDGVPMDLDPLAERYGGVHRVVFPRRSIREGGEATRKVIDALCRVPLELYRPQTYTINFTDLVTDEAAGAAIVAALERQAQRGR